MFIPLRFPVFHVINRWPHFKAQFSQYWLPKPISNTVATSTGTRFPPFTWQLPGSTRFFGKLLKKETGSEMMYRSCKRMLLIQARLNRSSVTFGKHVQSILCAYHQLTELLWQSTVFPPGTGSSLDINARRDSNSPMTILLPCIWKRS